MSQTGSYTPFEATETREDLSDVMDLVGYKETKLYKALPSGTASNYTHQWLTDTYASASSNAQIYSSDFTYSKETAPTRASGYVQLFSKTLEVDDLLKRFNNAGYSDEVSSRMNRKMVELLNDVEYALFNGTGNSGASGTAPELKGVLGWITTNVETGTGTGAETLTETMFNNIMANIAAYGAGSKFTAFGNSWQKRKISAFSTPSTRYIDAAEGKLTARVSVYESDFGEVTIEYTPRMPTDKLAILDIESWEKDIAMPAEMIDAAKVSHSTKKVIRTALTLASLAEQKNGQITGLATS